MKYTSVCELRPKHADKPLHSRINAYCLTQTHTKHLNTSLT